jgi:undecaprenyl diphosphate synthase
MDGNGRWAKAHNQPRIMGHYQGAKAVETVIRVATNHNLSALTLFAFSCENWNRPQQEVSGLLELFSEQIHVRASLLNKNNVQVQVVGDLSPLSERLKEDITYIEQLTVNNTGLKLIIALNYSGRWDITQAARNLARQAQDEMIDWQSVDENALQGHMCFPDVGEPDLLIRTSGEMRVSNFLLWHLAYTEFYFSSVLWPDFGQEEFERALMNYQARDRRFGSIDATNNNQNTLVEQA